MGGELGSFRDRGRAVKECAEAKYADRGVKEGEYELLLMMSVLLSWCVCLLF